MVVALRLGIRLLYGLRRLFPEDILVLLAWVLLQLTLSDDSAVISPS